MRLLILILLSWLTACAVIPEREDPADTAVLDALYRDVEVGDPESVILYVTPEMKAELDQVINRRWNELRQFRTLRNYLFEEEGRHIQYDPLATKTAAETFESGWGNCLSLSNLFVAAARYVGIDSDFKTVKVRPTWDQEGTTMIRYEHIVAEGTLGFGDDYVVDFLPEFTLENQPSNRITDVQALALYYNNLGAEAVVGGDNESGVEYMLKAIKLWPTNSDAWNNLGAAYKRLGESRLAELSYRRALRLDRNNYSALANLTQFFLAEDRRSEAEQYLDRVNRYYRRNPYFHYYLARLHYAAGDYERAIGYLATAVRLKRDDPEFYIALADSHRRLGDEETALRFEELSEKAKTMRRSSVRRERRTWIENVFITR